MYTPYIHQYQLLLSSRAALFDYCDNLRVDDLLTPLPSYNNQCMGGLLVHVANTYVGWLANFAMQQQIDYFILHHYQNLSAIQAAFEQVNVIVNDFLHQYTNKFEMPVTFPDQFGTMLTLTPLELFTHVITHEFHHKGQIVNMSRQLGYTPVDTDIIRY